MKTSNNNLIAPTKLLQNLDKSLEDNFDSVVKLSPRKEILCDGWYYDVTEFVNRHPGGSVINYYTKSGEDATLAVQQFHHRSSAKVNAIMKSFKKRPAQGIQESANLDEAKRHKALTEDFTNLYLELEKEGMFKPSYTHVLYRVTEIIALGYIGYLLLFSKSFAIKFLGCVSLGLAQGRGAMAMHEFGHYSMTGTPKIDKLLIDIIAGACLGVSATWWSRIHNRHHAMPQRLKHDVDLDTLPLLAFNSKCVTDATKGVSVFLKYQKYLFLPIDTFLVMNSWRLYKNPIYVSKNNFYREAILMGCHYLLAYQIGLWPWIVSSWFMAMYLFGNFALSHTHLPVTTEPAHWVEYGLLHTADVEQKPWCDWWMGYLNYQIEHHLFPTMPQFRHPKIHHRVRALAKRHGIPYYVYSYKDVVYKALRNLGDVAEEVKMMQQ